MTPPKSPASPRRPVQGKSAAPVAPRRNTAEERDWFASSRDLAEGLDVREFVETIPAELFDWPSGAGR